MGLFESIKNIMTIPDDDEFDEDLDQEPEEDDPWKIYMEIVDRIIKISIRLLKNSYSQSMKEDMIALCDYIKFELDTMDENQQGGGLQWLMQASR